MSALIDNSTCPECGAGRGEACRPDDEGVHSARVRDLIENGNYITRRQAHMEMHAGLKAAGCKISERESIFLTDEEVLGIYGAEHE